MSDPHGITPTPSPGEHGIQSAAHGHHGGGVAIPFGEAELNEFHKDDIHAGGAVIVLMTAIFTIGLILYTVVTVVVAR
jgi:hypothetical protein